MKLKGWIAIDRDNKKVWFADSDPKGVCRDTDPELWNIQPVEIFSQICKKLKAQLIMKEIKIISNEIKLEQIHKLPFVRS